MDKPINPSFNHDLQQEIYWDIFKPDSSKVYKFRFYDIANAKIHKVRVDTWYIVYEAEPLEDYDDIELYKDGTINLHLPYQSFNIALSYRPKKERVIGPDDKRDWIIYFKRTSKKAIKIKHLELVKSLKEVERWKKTLKTK